MSKDYLRFVFGARVGGEEGKGREGDVTNEGERKKLVNSPLSLLME
jgi:hypothetical protein